MNGRIEKEIDDGHLNYGLDADEDSGSEKI